jgi:hypothetical protein
VLITAAQASVEHVDTTISADWNIGCVLADATAIPPTAIHPTTPPHANGWTTGSERLATPSSTDNAPRPCNA